MVKVVVGGLFFWGACTTLGPMPATTGVSAVPTGRPGGEIGVGLVPGYYLSAGTQQSPSGAGLAQASLVLEPDRLLPLPGILVGARRVGHSDVGGYYEPLVGYRCHLDQDKRVAAMGVAYLTHASGSQNGTSYSATRGGAEVGFDIRMTPPSKLLEVHINAFAALTGLSARGRYCLDAAQRGTSCADPPVNPVDIQASGVYPSGNIGASFDFARHLDTIFHGGRLAVGVSGGTMPTAIGGQQGDAHWYVSYGGTLTFGFGARH